MEKENHGIFTKVGALNFNVMKTNNDGTGSNVETETSYISLQDKWSSMLKLFYGNVVLKAINNLSLYTSKHLNVSVKGDRQEAISGSSVEYIKGDSKRVIGTQTDSEIAAAKELNTINNAIQTARVDAVSNTKGTMVACPICSVTHLVDNKQGISDGIFGLIRKNLPPYFCFPLDTIQKLTSVLISPFLSQKKNIAFTGTKGCGSPGCKNGMIESPINAMKSADSATTRALKQNAEKIKKSEQQLKTGGTELTTVKQDMVFKIGLAKNNSVAFAKRGHNVFGLSLQAGPNSPEYLAINSKGSAPKIVHCPPQRTTGSLMFDVSNNFTVNAGSPGIDLQTSGRFNIMAGDVVVNATEGEAVFSSGNVTTIKGKNIIIDANDSSGDSGVSIESDQTMVHGGFSVRGNAAFKGHVTADGSLSVPHLIVPSMRTESSPSAPSKSKTEGANWGFGGIKAAATCLTKDLAFRYLMNGYIMTISGVYSLVRETYDLALLSTYYEWRTSGFGIGYGYVTLFNKTHNHSMCGMDHTHSVTTPLASYWNTRKGWGQERVGACPVPTPCPGFGDSPSPGPKSKPGGCGGGGLYVKDRNERYNLDLNDAYSGNNYIHVPITRKPDGSISTINGKTDSPNFSWVYSYSGIPVNDINRNNAITPREDGDGKDC